MASLHSHSQGLSIPHFSDHSLQLQEETKSRFSGRSSSLHPDQEGLRHMLQNKEGRTLLQVSPSSECKLPHSTGLQQQEHHPHPHHHPHQQQQQKQQQQQQQQHQHHSDNNRASSGINNNISSNSNTEIKETGGGGGGKQMDDKVYEASGNKLGAPTWLSSAVMRQQTASFVEGEESNRKWCGCEPGSQCVQCSFLHLQTHPAGASNSSTTQWLSTPMAMATKVQAVAAAAAAAAANATAEQLVGEDVPNESIIALSTQQSHGSADINHSPVQGRGLLDLHSDTANSSDLVDGDTAEQDNHSIWQNARLKADILTHPLYEQLLAAHVACLRIATPVDQLPRIDAQLAQSQHVVTKYSVLGQNHLLVGEEKDELDQFMTHYVLLLCSFKEQLQQHVRVHAMEAVMACWELEQSLLSLTGVSPGEGTGATMSDDDDDQGDSDPGIYDTGLDGHDSGGFGPLIPTETERSLMERVRQELKNELKTGYRERIVDVREEILRKRRAGKLPGDTTSVLKAWWHAHSKWPYPTEDEKARLVQETGLQLKQINNWFINQRKRNWHSNPSSAAALKSKRKR